MVSDHVVNESGRRQLQDLLLEISVLTESSQLLRLANIDDSVSTDISQEQILQLSSPRFVDHVIGNHPYMIGYFASHGLRMRPLPFRAACWMLETGENPPRVDLARRLRPADQRRNLS